MYKPKGIKKYYHIGKRLFAKKWLEKFDPIQIAITGSQGKTTTTRITTEVLEKFGKTIRTDKSLDTTFNVPITALKVRKNTKFLIWELGVDHIGEMSRHLEIARPSISCITGISPVHTDDEHFGSLENLLNEKKKIIQCLKKDGTAILNFCNKYTKGFQKDTKAKVKFFGTDKSCDIFFDEKSVKVDLLGTSADLYFKDKEKKINIKIGLIGKFHLYNVMASFLICNSAAKNFDEKVFVDTLKTIKPSRGRMNVEKGPLETIILNDSLRANPESTRAGLEALSMIDYKKGKKIAVIGEMGELENPIESHKKTGEEVSKMNIDFLVCIGPLRKYTRDEAIKHGFDEKKIAYAKDVFEAADVLKKILQKNDLWYLKGSLLRNYMRIVKLLEGQEVCCNATLCPYEHCQMD